MRGIRLLLKVYLVYLKVACSSIRGFFTSAFLVLEHVQKLRRTGSFFCSRICFHHPLKVIYRCI